MRRKESKEGELLSVSSHCHKPLQWTDCLGQKRGPWRQTSLGRGRLSFLLPAPCTPCQVRQASRKPPAGPTMSVLGDGMDRQKQDSGGRSLECYGVSGGASSTPFSPAPHTGMGWACSRRLGGLFPEPSVLPRFLGDENCPSIPHWRQTQHPLARGTEVSNALDDTQCPQNS